jgi:aspartokinase
VISPVFSEGRIQFFTEGDSEGEWQKHLGQLSVEGFVKGFHIDRDLVPLSVVGYRFSQDGAALQAVIELLARHKILVTMGSASALAITVAVPRKYAEEGSQALHAEFIEKGVRGA